MTSSRTASRRTGRARCRGALGLVAAMVLVLTSACGGDDVEAVDPTGTDLAVEDPDTSATEALPEAAGTFVELGPDAREEVTSDCVTSTPTRSTVLATAPSGMQVAVTVFTTAPGPELEVDVVTADGRRLTAERVTADRWDFQGARIVGDTPVSEAGVGDQDLAFAVDFSEELPSCDNQDRLGPGETPTGPAFGDGDASPSETDTPDVIRT